ncbi:hypothetical protein A2U01_0076691, partial [Trifolium medium]|nr:hypothetical protein [Trifolium medium]
MPLAGKQICSKYDGDGFAMYEFEFRDLGFRLPFSYFTME